MPPPIRDLRSNVRPALFCNLYFHSGTDQTQSVNDAFVTISFVTCVSAHTKELNQSLLAHRQQKFHTLGFGNLADIYLFNQCDIFAQVCFNSTLGQFIHTFLGYTVPALLARFGCPYFQCFKNILTFFTVFIDQIWQQRCRSPQL